MFKFGDSDFSALHGADFVASCAQFGCDAASDIAAAEYSHYLDHHTDFNQQLDAALSRDCIPF